MSLASSSRASIGYFNQGQRPRAEAAGRPRATFSLKLFSKPSASQVISGNNTAPLLPMMNADVQSIAQMAQHLQHPHDDTDDDAAAINGRKRKADDNGQPLHQQQRARRNRYVSIACNECKRRKIKCNGETPCQRCGNLNLECVYAPNCCSGFKESQEYKEMQAHISLLQDHVNSLYEGLNALRAQVGRGTPMSLPSIQQQQQQHTPIDPSLQSSPYPSGRTSYPSMHASPEVTPTVVSPRSARPRSSSHGKPPKFRGPTSSAFSIGVAKNSLQTMGITSKSEEDETGTAGAGVAEESPERTPPPRVNNNQLLQTMHSSKDPIWSIPQEEALRLCRVYEDEMGMMYPILDIEKLIEYAKKLYRFMDAALRTGLMQQGLPGADAIQDDDTNILKVILALGMAVESAGSSDMGQRLFECVQPAIDNVLLDNVSIKGIRLLTMTAMYEFHRDNEGTSWRIIGLAARLCMELGLHRRETYEAMPDDVERSEAILLFWAIYNLDRRWAFGTGMPFALQDSDVDSQIPKPRDRSPYLSAMIPYSAIGSKVWRSVTTAQPTTGSVIINTEDMNYLDYQVIQWHRAIPARLRFEHPSQTTAASTPGGVPSSRAEHRIRILLYLRANQMRTHIYLPVLHSATTIMQYREQAQTAIDVAKDSIRVLTHINQTTDLYRTQQALFNAFLTAALGVLFLAVSHAPATFATNVREEFYMALDLVRGFSKRSWVSKRLWKTIRVLKEVGPKLGLPIKEPGSGQQPNHGPTGKDDTDPNRSAAVAMAGLAGHDVDDNALYEGQVQRWPPGYSGGNGSPEGMVNDLTHLFEAAGGFQANGTNGERGSQEGAYRPVSNFAESTAYDDGLANILKELF